MSNSQLMEEFHIPVHVPRGLPESEYSAMRRVLNQSRFRATLLRAIRVVFVGTNPCAKRRFA